MLAEMGAQGEGPKWPEGPARRVRQRVGEAVLRWKRLRCGLEGREQMRECAVGWQCEMTEEGPEL